MARQSQQHCYIAYDIKSLPARDPLNFTTGKIRLKSKPNKLINLHAGLLTLWLVLLIGWLINTVAINPCYAETGQKTDRILYINSYSPGYSWSDGIHNGLVERFKSSGRKIEMSVEYLDSRRFPDPSLQEKLADVMQTKYETYRHDLVIVSDNAAFDFAMGNRDRLFPSIPIVFCGYNSFSPENLEGSTNITGVNEDLDFVGLIDLALQVQPHIRTLVFILSTGDLSSESISKKLERDIIPQYRNKYQIISLKDAPMAEIRETLSGLSNESVVFLVGQTSDTGEGRALTPIENGFLITAASPWPVYTLWDFHLNTGVLGGLILTGYDQGRAAAEIALKILNGQSADSIPVVMQSPARPVFDYAVMERFNIKMADLPKRSRVINKPFSFYEEHKRIVWSTVIVFAALVLLILVLIINILRRIRAERLLQAHRDHLEQQVKKRTAELTDSEERFRSLSDAAFEGVVLSEDGRIIEVNKAVCEIFGYRPSEVFQKPLIDFVTTEEREDVLNKLASRYEESYEVNCVKKDGSIFPAEVTAKMFTYRGRDVRVTAVRDLTEQKQAEEEIKALRGILPLCSICKKIRDDKGYWEQVDIYIDKHSQAEISHGLCPDCLKKYYPEEYATISSDKTTIEKP